MAQAMQHQNVAATTMLFAADFMPTRCRRKATDKVSGRWFETDQMIQVGEPAGDASTGNVIWPMKERRTGQVLPVASTRPAAASTWTIARALT